MARTRYLTAAAKAKAEKNQPDAYRDRSVFKLSSKIFRSANLEPRGTITMNRPHLHSRQKGPNQTSAPNRLEGMAMHHSVELGHFVLAGDPVEA
jgi:hypothetical protein